MSILEVICHSGVVAVIKKAFIFLSIIAIAILFWMGFALWTGIYSVYSIPPGKEYADGVTIIVTRQDGEPTFNSPDYKEPPKEISKETGIGFGKPTMRKKPLVMVTIVELPFIEWAYKKSLEPQTP